MATLSIETALTPCSIEFCPSQPQLGTCGQYQTQQVAPDTQVDEETEISDKGLTKQTSSSDCPKIERLGKCILFETRLDQNESPHPPSINYQQLQSIDCAAILDQRWTQDSEQPVLITADSEGTLNSYKFKKQLGDSSKPQLELIHTFSCCDQSSNQSTLSLALDISDKLYRSRPKTVCSLSNGEVVLLEQDLEGAQLIETDRWLAHDYEPWTCGFDYWQPDTILTGGDDCKMKVWDSRNSLHTPVMINKQFDGGVTAIRSHHLREHIFAVGSYDSGLRIFDKRNFKKEILKYNAGGGIWRIKWHETDYSQVLLATMHDGFKVISITEHEQEEEGKEDLVCESESTSYDKSKIMNAQVIANFKHRSSLAYGADWGAPFSFSNSSHSKTDANALQSRNYNLIGSCSFYDRMTHFWFAI